MVLSTLTGFSKQRGITQEVLECVVAREVAPGNRLLARRRRCQQFFAHF